MRKMKDSGIEWIGEIPQEWKVLPAKIVFSENKQKNVDGLEQNALKFYNGTIIQKSNFDAEDDDYVAETIRNYTVVRHNMIMINGLNLNYDLKSLRVAIVTQNGIITSAYLSLIPDECRIVPKFAVYLFKGYETKMAFHNVGAGIRKTLGYKEFKNQPVLVPSLPEQERIAEFLDKRCAEIDKVIADTQKTIEEYKALKQSIITEAVTKGIRKNRPMKDSGIEWIGEIPQEYQLYKLKHLLKSSLMYGANESGIPFDNSLPRYIRITDITIDGKLKDCDKLSLPTDIAKEYLLSDNDVLFARSGATVGKAFIYKENYGKCAFAGYLIKASLNKKIIPKYLFLYTQSTIYEEWKKQIFIQATIQNIGADRYSNLPIVLPLIPEQQEIVDYLDIRCAEIDNLISAKEQLLTEMESYKKSVIYEYVTGKKEVHNY